MIRLEHAFGCRCTCVRRAVYCCVCSLDKTRNIYVTTSGDEVERTYKDEWLCFMDRLASVGQMEKNGQTTVKG